MNVVVRALLCHMYRSMHRKNDTKKADTYHQNRTNRPAYALPSIPTSFPRSPRSSSWYIWPKLRDLHTDPLHGNIPLPNNPTHFLPIRRKRRREITGHIIPVFRGILGQASANNALGSRGMLLVRNSARWSEVLRQVECIKASLIVLNISGGRVHRYFPGGLPPSASQKLRKRTLIHI